MSAAVYGSWASPIAADQIASKSLGLSSLSVHDGYAYWLELRPTEQGTFDMPFLHLESNSAPHQISLLRLIQVAGKQMRQ
jgi:hypothetical protein